MKVLGYFLPFVLFVPGILAATDTNAPREKLAALDALRLDPHAVYDVAPENRIELHRAHAAIDFDEGKFAFFSALDGRISGVVFSGRGHILAAPRDPVEKQQMALFVGTPVLDEDFTSAYLRFSDDTSSELLQQLQRAHLVTGTDAAFVDGWDTVVARLNPQHSMRLYADSLSSDPRPYFYALLTGVATGPFDFVFDPLREEPVLIGQSHRSDTLYFYDVWASYRVPEIQPKPIPFHAQHYVIDTTILPDNSIEGSATLKIGADVSGERLLMLQMSRDLDVSSVTLDDTPVAYFHNEDADARHASRNGDVLYVILPDAPHRGDSLQLSFRYKGRVIQDAGNGVLFISDRESWYPHLGGTGSFASYDLTMRWPRKLRLVATGTKLDEREDGEYRVGHWRTNKPASVAGFNLGEYVYASLPTQTYSVDVYANRQLEQALVNRLKPPAFEADPNLPSILTGRRGTQALAMPMPQPSPADALKLLGREIDSSIKFFENYCGPFPYQQLAVSQIPGTFGQGWPGLLYLSTYSFLPAQAQARAGLSTTTQQHFTDLVPFHEVAHQWWGNVVGWSSYRDQWLDESIANYLALLFADSQKDPDARLHTWLERYRANLTAKEVGSDTPIVDYGSLALGSRLTSSKTPAGFEQLVYGKGSWVIHMLREMLRQPGAKNPDARFDELLHTLMIKYSYRALSTEDFQREVEAIMTPSMDLEDNHSMDWFFDEWVRGTGIPHYRVEYSVRRTEKGYFVKGVLYQTQVPRSFVAPVPLYSNTGAYLSRVIAGGPETSFHFVTSKAPGKIEIDPHMTLLCVAQR